MPSPKGSPATEASKEVGLAEVFRSLADILQTALRKIQELERNVTKDLESIRRQLDAVSVLKQNIANLNSKIDLFAKKLSSLSLEEPQELSQLLLRAISELDKRMQMFTITEILSRLEHGSAAVASSPTSSTVSASTPSVQPTSPAPTIGVSAGRETVVSESPRPAPRRVAASSSSDEEYEPSWRERMRQKYGLKRKPGSLLDPVD